MKTKRLVFDESNTTELYVLFLELVRHQARKVEQETRYQLQGLETQAEVEREKANLARLEQILDFFRCNNTTLITELPY